MSLIKFYNFNGKLVTIKRVFISTDRPTHGLRKNQMSYLCLKIRVGFVNIPNLTLQSDILYLQNLLLSILWLVKISSLFRIFKYC